MKNNQMICKKIMDYVPYVHRLLCISKKFNEILDNDMLTSYLYNECKDIIIIGDFYTGGGKKCLAMTIKVNKNSVLKHIRLLEKINSYNKNKKVCKLAIRFTINILIIYNLDDLYNIWHNKYKYNHIYINNAITFDMLYKSGTLITFITDDVDIDGITNRIAYIEIITIKDKKYRKYNI